MPALLSAFSATQHEDPKAREKAMQEAVICCLRARFGQFPGSGLAGAGRAASGGAAATGAAA